MTAATHHLVHIRVTDLNGTEEVLVRVPVVTAEDGLTGTLGELRIPARLRFTASWIYNIDTRKIIKNKTGRNFINTIGVPEVDAQEWLDRYKPSVSPIRAMAAAQAALLASLVP